MARGKHATLAANRRSEAAHEVIDRLTSELAEAKMRARHAEATARRVLEVERLLKEHNNDEALQAAVQTLDEWEHIASKDRARREAALGELWSVLAKDIQVPPNFMGPEDLLELFARRYPKILTALSAGTCFNGDGGWSALRDGRVDRTSNRVRGMVKDLSDESIKRLQHAMGVRVHAAWDPNRDMADVAIELLDARQVGFSDAEVLEYMMAKP